MEHLFWECPIVVALWTHSGLEHLGHGLPRQTFPLFLINCLLRMTQRAEIMALVALLWRIWKSRNWVSFEGKLILIPQLMRQYHQQLHERVSLPEDRLAPDRHPLQHNLEVVDLTYVVMWDEAVRADSHSVGGLIIKDGGGPVLLARGMVFEDVVNPLVVDTIVLREPIQWC
ncbi:unnamed protein product [Linum trigynum]|uniref:Uncharacterized protein n=1 Tax=Linum trigynum TaxID=586398 RepID=A0AAV2G6S1_9ROSI